MSPRINSGVGFEVLTAVLKKVLSSGIQCSVETFGLIFNRLHDVISRKIELVKSNWRLEKAGSFIICNYPSQYINLLV